MKLTLGFSPCPNDTFIFEALVHHKIDTEGLEFEVVFADVKGGTHKMLMRKKFYREMLKFLLNYQIIQPK